MLEYFADGVKSNSMKECLATSNALVFMNDYIAKVLAKDSQQTLNIQQLLSQNSQKLAELLEIIMESMLSEESNFIWTLSKPLLGLIILNEENFQDIKNYAISKATSNLESQEKLQQGINKLMQGVNRSLSLKNKDRFSKNFSELRQVIASIK